MTAPEDRQRGGASARQLEVHRRKTSPFTVDELEAFAPKRPLLAALNGAYGDSGKPASRFRILDIGCGRGLTVAYWLQQGLDAFGGEASGDQLELARTGLRTAGLDPARIVELDSSTGRYPLEDAGFDFVYSDNVIEHVEDLGAFCAEVVRLTACGGRGFHIFPSKWKPVEVHVRVPFVHWMPKNSLRYWWLRASIGLGRDPGWVRNHGKSARDKAMDYYHYVNEQTYYRPAWRIRRAFENEGHTASFDMTGDVALGKSSFLRAIRVLRPLATTASVLFHTTILTTTRGC